MNDMFGKRIKDGDIVIYVGRQSSTTYLTIARVLVVRDHNVRVKTLAGNQGVWLTGKFGRDKTQELGVRSAWGYSKFEGHEAVLRTSRNVMVANGIDALGIHNSLMSQQKVR